MLQRVGPLLGLIGLLCVSLFSRTSDARLEPYYVVNGLSFGQVQPRILFVLDTSGSMTWKSQPSAVMCEFDSCEDDNAGSEQSRIHAARTAIHTIVETVGDAANFGFMTFDQETPPSSNGSIPSTCSNGWRFNYSFNAYQAFYTVWGVFFDVTTPNEGIYWWLCGKNRPYAYLRYDNLGHGINVSNGVDPIPDSPILKGNNLWWTDNGTRKVQWFPDFRGVRINVHHNNAGDKDFIANSWGDYGNKQGQNPSATQKAEISGKDFYYWPYVDGFTGYSYWQAAESTSEYYALGHVIEDNSLNQGALYGPFYLEFLGGNFSQDELGPSSLEEARTKVLNMTEDFSHGGVDASGGTPWTQTVGPITAAPPASNGVFSHPTVASYLKFAKNVSTSDACVPTATILVTDGEPNCAFEGNGTCSQLNNRLSAIRNELDSLVYVVGFFVSGQSLNNMACAGAGGCSANGTCTSPCTGTPTQSWDTCYNTSDPANECAWIANSAEELAEALGSIVQGIVDVDVDSGPGASALDVGVGAGSQSGSGDLIATSLKAHTEFPDWKGHVIREACDIIDPDTGLLEEYCQDNGVFDFIEPTFGPCPQSRTWDAGECLQQRDPATRKIYINDENNDVYLISNPAGGASGEFFAQLNSSDLNLPGAPFTQDEADDIADFITGVGWKDDWKLSGLANSSPIIVRRIPPKQSDFAPSVGIRDPHCAGRLLAPDSEVAPELVTFAEEVWDPSNYVGGSNPHHAYQEAAIVGSDLGLVHAFQFDSGNELFAYLPRYNLHSAVAQFAEGGEEMGQPLELEDHHYGVAATANQGWVWDPDKDNGAGGWRHLLIIGGGKGGQNYSVLDVSHMSPEATEGPLEVMWTTFDPGLRTTYEPLLGETWARPALIYQLENDYIEELPKASFVLGSGYQSETPTSAIQGRAIARVNAVDGSVQDWNRLPSPAAKRYESNFGSVVDLAVGTHCISRYWGEAQETYFLDPSGRFYRWDLGSKTNHEADWGGPWGNTGQTAQKIATFRACQSTGASCNISSTGMREPFTMPVAVVSSNRIDDAEAGAPVELTDPSQQDQFLIAFASGSLYDDSVDGGDDDNDFHSSMYIVVDDHRGADKTKGIEIPTTSDRVDAGDDEGFARIVLSDLERTRTFTPFPGSQTYVETEKFSKAARPVKAPLIRVSRARDLGQVTDPTDQAQLDAAIIGGLEVYYIEFTIYEPSPEACDSRFYDADNDVWYLDEGSTYTIRLRLTASEASGFDLVNGAGVPYDDGLFSKGGLELGTVQQVLDGDCADGSCGPKHGVPSVAPCDPNTDPNFVSVLGTRSIGYSELRGFNPYERDN